MAKRLADLNPKLTGTLDDGILVFDCPLPGHTHRHNVALGPGEWTATGGFPDTLTLWPSIDASAVGCWHGWITDGDVR